ncbi:hypothetical protein NDN08_005355 [Rhodosorus marinus]|uniref:Uncharacterized protein n=1 Tax=Rhodosorus marinus TaxID=101924 RepID=A0AAV8V2A9_9RHOD|nr:hypothetical protein NDN08_005355 [Rhodosorus marinus]
MLRMRFLLAFLTLLLGAFGRSRICNDYSCRDICNVGTTCKPVRMNFVKECDDDHWVDVGLEKPDPEVLCTQCCDEHCNAVQTFPNCTGGRCKQCYDGSNGSESTQNYDLECCDTAGAVLCGLCTIPEGWNADWEAELQSQLPEGATLVNGDYSCAGNPGDGCAFCQVEVTSAEESCNLSRDLRCKGYYESEKSPECTSCIPRWKKIQFISKSFEKLTVQCKAGDSAKCEKVRAGIVSIDVTCPQPCVKDMKGAAVRVRNLDGGQSQTFFLGFGDLGQATNRAADGNLGNQPDMSFSLEYEPSSGLVAGTHTTVSNGSLEREYMAVNSSSGMVNPITGEILDHEICELFVRAQGTPDAEAAIIVSNLQLTIGSTGTPMNLGTFIHNSSEGDATIANFCRDDYNQGFKFTGDITLEGVFSNSQEGSKVEIQCGTRPQN